MMRGYIVVCYLLRLGHVKSYDLDITSTLYLNKIMLYNQYTEILIPQKTAYQPSNTNISVDIT